MPHRALHDSRVLNEKPPATQRAALWIAAAAFLALVATAWVLREPAREHAATVLDPAHIIVLRTPGGFLEVGAIEKAEEFGWSARYTCPLMDCPRLLKPTISRIKVRARYVYRVPLQAQWKLLPQGDHYQLTVPAPQLQEPVGFHTPDMEIRTTKGGWLSPPAAPNQQAVLRHLGPELARRGNDPAYLQAQRPYAEKTVQEFARKWMIEQGHIADLPIRVTFAGPAPA